MKFYAKAIEEAGSVDPFEVSKAVRGLTIDTPIGPMTIRAIDGQSTMGLWVGRTELVDGKPAFVEYQYEEGSKFLPSEEEVMEMRRKNSAFD